jgi:putative hemolysin
MTVAFEVVFVLLLVLINGVFAGSEIAVVSARKARLQRRGEEGDSRSARALELANDPNRFLSTVQIGITLVGVLAGAFGGATIAQHLASLIADVPALASYAPAIGIGVVVASITFLTLVVGELVPKRLALAYPERISAAIAKPMHRLSRLATPLVRLLGASTDLVLRLLAFRPPTEPAVTTDDIRVLLEQCARAGVILAAEQDIVENVFWLGDQRVNSVMTPRHRIVWLDVSDTPQAHARTMLESPQARYILCDGTLDDVVGVASMKDVWPRSLAGRPLDVRANSIMPLFVPMSTRALTVLEQFRKSGVHVALVMDEEKKVAGMVTLTDILEGLVGELVELAEDEVVQREDGSWLVSASVAMADVHDLLGLPEPTQDDDVDYHTLGGFIMHRFGRVPTAADYFYWEGYRVEVVDMDGRRIDKVLIERS